MLICGIYKQTNYSNVMKKAILLLGTVFFFISCQKQNENILFSSSSSGNSDIYIMNIETLTATQLTKTTTEEWAPTWINKNTISFLRQENDQITRHQLNLDTGEETQIAHPENCVLDDKNMLYTANGTLQLYPCKANIFLVDTNSGVTTNLTEDLDGFSNYPSWSFDGTEVIFTNNQFGNNDLYKVNIQTKKITKLVDHEANDERGSLSPNAKYLVFSSDRAEKGNQDIYLLNLETNSLENITNSKGTELIARWSADGKQVYFGSNTDGNWELYQYTINEKSTKRITNNEAFDGDPRVFKN